MIGFLPAVVAGEWQGAALCVKLSVCWSARGTSYNPLRSIRRDVQAVERGNRGVVNGGGRQLLPFLSLVFCNVPSLNSHSGFSSCCERMWRLHLDERHAAFFSRHINDSKLMKTCTWKLLFHVLLNWYHCVTPRLVPWNISLLFTHARPLVTVRANQRLRWKQHQTTEVCRCCFQYLVSVQRADKPEWVRWRQTITPTLGWCKETFTDAEPVSRERCSFGHNYTSNSSLRPVWAYMKDRLKHYE